MAQDRFCLNINLSNFSVTQYCSYDFNSFCKIGNKHFGASEDGIFELIGNDDTGIDISAFFELIVSDWGISNMKRVRSVYVGGESHGNLNLTLKDDENNARTYTLPLASGGKQKGATVNIDRDGVGRYWQVRIGNIGGHYFAIDNIEVLAILLTRNPK